MNLKSISDSAYDSPSVAEEQVVSVYRALLGRDPESAAAVQDHLRQPSLEHLIRTISLSSEFTMRMKAGPLWNYTSSFDPIALAVKYENRKRIAVEGHRVNFLGVAINIQKFFPSLTVGNEVEAIPLPGNWHTDIAEIGAALRAVDISTDTFTMIELGCGWGCWMNMTGSAARSAGKKVALIGVEAEEGHVAFAHESLKTNAFSQAEYQIVRGIAAGQTGSAFFPRQNRSGDHWGLEPRFGPTTQEQERLRSSGDFDELEMVPLEAIVRNHARIDLLHMDIQGGESNFIRGCMPVLNGKVAYIVVGTHSRIIDGEIIGLLSSNGWELEIERPTVFLLDSGQPKTIIDGIQGWRNPGLLRTL